MLAIMKEEARDPYPLAFVFRSGGPWLNPRRSYVTIASAITPTEDSELRSTFDEGRLRLTTTNVRSMVLDGDALAAKAIDTIEVDGTVYPVTGGSLHVGPKDGKTTLAHGPIQQLFHRPWCFVYDNAGAPAHRQVAAFLATHWVIAGNGQTCTVPRSRVSEALARDYQLIFVGVNDSELPEPFAQLEIALRPEHIALRDQRFEHASIVTVFPGPFGRLAGAWFATRGDEHLLFRQRPFRIQSQQPDFVVHQTDEARLVGFFTSEWKLDTGLAEWLQ